MGKNAAYSDEPLQPPAAMAQYSAPWSTREFCLSEPTDAETPSLVAFPTSEPPSSSSNEPQPRPTHLPFRRISLPTAPSQLHRQSIASVASLEWQPREGSAPLPALMRNMNPARKTRPLSTDNPKRGNRRSMLPDLHEAKRRKIIQEFHETERAYVNGLELIYSHFLTPIIISLETPQPLLDRSALTTVFSNFIDIWNLHRAFFASLTNHLSKSLSSSPDEPLSSLLLSHFPYLSLYTPFVTAFPTTLSSLVNLTTADNHNGQYSLSFATFIKTQETDPRCGKLKLQDWLLTIVQRCPRYLLLLKDLIECTPLDDPEHAKLVSVQSLVSKITSSLNTSLHSHAQTLALLALQKATPNLPFQLISPGRTLLKRASLLQLERSEPIREREFLLFSDCLIWLASEDSEPGWMNIGWGNGNGANSDSPVKRPIMIRTRSKSEAEIPSSVIRSRFGGHSPTKSRSVIPPPRRSSPNNRPRQHHSPANESDKWVFKGQAGLVDLEVIVSPQHERGEERRFEVLSPSGSFVLFADTEQERDEWCDLIRQAKTQWLSSLNITNPNSTLTSSSSTKHIRLSLQALPFSADSKGKKKERRGSVEHWVPAIWIPDEKAVSCMRCGHTFGWRRRRHHCRLCGRCVCASCSERTFYIVDPNTDDGSNKPARSCNACYETVFPVLDNEGEAEGDSWDGTVGANTLGSLSRLPFLTSMPSLPLSSSWNPESLMAINQRDSDDSGASRVRSPGPPSRPRSFHPMFEQHDHSRFDLTSPVEEESDSASLSSTKRHTVNLTEDVTLQARREDTARRNKRFSMPAVALQTTSVTTRSGQVSEIGGGLGSKMQFGQGQRSKRFSLVLGHKQRRSEVSENTRSAAVGRLSELLGRKTHVEGVR